MVDITFYLVSKEIAQRSGSLETAYRVADGRYIVDNKDLSRIHMTPQEFMHGLDGVEQITKDQAKELIARNKYSIGEPEPYNENYPSSPQVGEEENDSTEVQETDGEGAEGTNDPNDEGEGYEETSEGTDEGTQEDEHESEEPTEEESETQEEN